MKNAGQAMKQIHSGLTIDKVDETLYGIPYLHLCYALDNGTYADMSSCDSDELREQHALSEEIASAIMSAGQPTGVDEDDLEAELEGLEQEQIDEAMLKTGTVPVGDEVGRLPNAGTKEREYIFPVDISALSIRMASDNTLSKSQYARSHKKRTTKRQSLRS